MPVRTLPYAVANAPDGAVLVLRTGSYAAVTVSRSLTIKGDSGAIALMGTITSNVTQLYLKGLSFIGQPVGVEASGGSPGSLLIEDCRFDGTTVGVSISGVNYAAIHRCTFSIYDYGVRAGSSTEIVVSNNIFYSGKRAVDISSVDRLDLWRNNIYGSTSTSGIGFPDSNLRAIYRTLNVTNISDKSLALPSSASPNGRGGYDVAMNVVQGPSFGYGLDFTVIASGGIVSWTGLRLQSELRVGDVVRVLYSESGSGSGVTGANPVKLSGVLDPNSSIDSNNVNGAPSIDVGVFINTPVIIRNNNFYGASVGYTGAVPTEAANNIYSDPNFTNPGAGDFRLLSSSPDRDAADQTRWNRILGEMGVTGIAGWTAPATRANVAPLGRDLDNSYIHRYVYGLTGDIGAIEYNINEFSTGSNVSERGHDIGAAGSTSDPYATIDRAYNRSGGSDVTIQANSLPVQGSYGYTAMGGPGRGRYRSSDLRVSDAGMLVGTQTDADTVYVLSSQAAFETGPAVWVSPDGSNWYTGTESAPYATIDRALQDSPMTVFVKPGIYPPFQGVTGVRVIGMEQSYSSPVVGQLEMGFTGAGWTGSGSWTARASSLTIRGDARVTLKSMISPEIRLKYVTDTTADYGETELTDSAHSVWVSQNTTTSQMRVAYGWPGVQYEYYYPYTGAVGVSVIGASGASTVTLTGSALSANVVTGLTGFYGPYRLYMRHSGPGAMTATKFALGAGGFQGRTGILELPSHHKVYGLIGSTGLSYRGVTGIFEGRLGL